MFHKTLSLPFSKIILLAAFFSASTAYPINFSPLFNAIGTVADLLISKGKINKEDKKMFKEVAASLNIENKKVQARNSGLLLRLLFGYNNALAIQFYNRVYMNEAALKEMSEGEKKFLMAHELTHIAKNHAVIKVILTIFLSSLQKVVVRIAEKNDISHDDFRYRYFTHGYCLGFVTLDIWSLMQGYLCQKQETEADTDAVVKVGVDPDDGVKCMHYLYYPNTQNWPLYAKIEQWIKQKVMLPLCNLPIIKQHVQHLVSFNERVEHIQSLKDQWQNNLNEQFEVNKNIEATV